MLSGPAALPLFAGASALRFTIGIDEPPDSNHGR
jgi:hypothetical protein